MIHRPPAPTDHAENFPKLRICPHCGCDLRERPERGHCPECTIEHDEQTWSMPCWTDFKSTRQQAWPLVLLLGGAVACVILVGTWGAIIAAALLAIFFWRLMTLRSSSAPNAALIAWPEGLSIRVGRSRRMKTILWPKCGEVIVHGPAKEPDHAYFEQALRPSGRAVMRALRQGANVRDAHEIAIRRKPTGRGPALAEVVVVEGDDAFAESVKVAIERRTVTTSPSAEPAAGRTTEISR